MIWISSHYAPVTPHCALGFNMIIFNGEYFILPGHLHQILTSIVRHIASRNYWNINGLFDQQSTHKDVDQCPFQNDIFRKMPWLMERSFLFSFYFVSPIMTSLHHSLILTKANMQELFNVTYASPCFIVTNDLQMPILQSTNHQKWLYNLHFHFVPQLPSC